MPDRNRLTEGGRAQRRTPHPGQMTAAMRSVPQATGPKVLRVGLVVGGRLLEERILRKRTSVTVGPTEQAMFIVEANVPPGFKLFERIGRAYYLNTIDGMSGRLALPTGMADLETLRAQAPRSGPTHAIRIADETRGKVVIGAATFLFQFVTLPPVQPPPRLPLCVRDGMASRIDWVLTAISAFSFLLHFGVVGAMYSDWMDTIVDHDITVGLVHTIEPAVAPVTEARDEAVPSPAETQPALTSETRPEPAPSKAGPLQRASPDAPLDALLRDLNRLDLTVIGSVNGGPNLRALMTSSDSGVPVNFDDLDKHATPIGRTSSGLDLPTGGPIELHRSDFGLPTHETGSVPSGAGRPTRLVLVPDVHEATPVLSAPLPDAEAVIRSQIHPGARHCYEIGLGSDPSQSGRLVLMIRVAPSGEVDSASIVSNAGLSTAVASCVASVARRAKFDRTGPGGATIVVPFAFLRQGK